MIATTLPQPISGVSASSETTIDTVYPSNAATGLGRLLGRLFHAFPPVSYVLFIPPAIPFALAIYLLMKLLGDRYELTNRSLRVRKSIGVRLLGQAPLAEIGDVAVSQQAGQKFYRAANLHVLDGSGNPVLTLPGVPCPERFRQLILEARDARRQTEASLASIRARHA